MAIVTSYIAPNQGVAQVSQIDGPIVSLAGNHLFLPGDDLNRAARNYDDSDWQHVNIPSMFSENSVPLSEQLGWFRIHFEVPTGFSPKHPAFVAYLVKDYEVYLNGTRIGAVPYFGERGIDPTVTVPTGRFSLHPFSDALLDRTGDNVIAIRLGRLMLLEDAGIARLPIALVAHEFALVAAAPVARFHWLVNGLKVGINAVLSVFALAIVLFGTRDRVILSFTAMIVALTVVDITQLHAMFDLELATPATEALFVLMLILAMLANLEFSAAILQIRPGYVVRFLQICACLAFLPKLGTYNLADNVGYIAQALAAGLFSIAWLGSFVWIGVMCVIAIRRGTSMGWFMLALYGALVSVPVLWSAVNPKSLFAFSFMFGDTPLALLKEVFLVSLSGYVGLRLYRIQRDLAQANQRAVLAQEQERKRVARDLHDSVGQWLATIKLRLQLLGEKSTTVQRKPLQKLAVDMDALIEDTRRIAHDLSYLSVANQGIKSAICRHLKSLSDSHGTLTEAQIDTDLNLPDRVADHLYRIVQEATNNAIRHGRAGQVEVALKRQPDGRICLSIRDDGIGFDQENPNSLQTLGLVSLRERAQMIDGTVTIKSTANKGAEILVETSRAD